MTEQITFICITKCYMDLMLYDEGEKVVRPEDWENSNFEIFNSEAMGGFKKKPAHLPGQAPTRRLKSPSEFARKSEETNADLMKKLDNIGIEYPKRANKAELQLLIESVDG